MWLYLNLFVLLPVDGNLDYCQIWAIVNKAAMNIA